MEKYSRNQQIIDGELDNNQVMLNIEKGKYFGLNPVGKRIWDLIEQPKSFPEITETLLTEFDVTKEQCEEEVRAFLDKAVQNEIIVKSE
ncbi:MAG: lasso peptide biosynthesis PqqD family chaperone [Bacteroidales bacterium]|nr:lasso peptide biosynthesis PqqD family chaperone [Bacteroidales bacterium]